jgi:hypothetical protein
MATARMLLAIPLILGFCGCSGERLTDVTQADVGIADPESASPTETVEWTFQWETQYAEGAPADVALADDVNSWQSSVSRAGGYAHNISGE